MHQDESYSNYVCFVYSHSQLQIQSLIALLWKPQQSSDSCNRQKISIAHLSSASLAFLTASVAFWNDQLSTHQAYRPIFFWKKHFIFWDWAYQTIVELNQGSLIVWIIFGFFVFFYLCEGMAHYHLHQMWWISSYGHFLSCYALSASSRQKDPRNPFGVLSWMLFIDASSIAFSPLAVSPLALRPKASLSLLLEYWFGSPLEILLAFRSQDCSFSKNHQVQLSLFSIQPLVS